MNQQPKKRSSTTLEKVGQAEDISPQGEPLGEYLDRVRQLRGLTIAALAKRAGVNASTLVRMKAGTTSVTRPRAAVQQRLAMALQIPVEYLQAAVKQEPFSMPLTNRVCANCWVPGNLPDIRWSQIDARFCMRCGEQLIDKCSACSEPILLHGRFCPQCGKPYGNSEGREKSLDTKQTKASR